jgi:hypothetical protein
MEEEKEAIVFSDEELFSALDKHVGKKKAPTLLPGESLDPGTITRPEMEERYGFGREAAMAHIKMLIKKGVLVRDWVDRADEWPPYGARSRQGYRYTGKAFEEEGT